ncbi:hypothetical protein ABZZ80_21380 [Streptomyces sp. NPDC006356]
MPYLIPSRTPLTPEQVERGFDYLLALQRGGGAAVAGRAEADPELAFILLRLYEDVVWPITAVDGEAEPCADSFALDEVRCVLLSALRDWARGSPTTAALGVARSIIGTHRTVTVCTGFGVQGGPAGFGAGRAGGHQCLACVGDDSEVLFAPHAATVVYVASYDRLSCLETVHRSAFTRPGCPALASQPSADRASWAKRRAG